jgi:hypothetical protein
VCLDARNLFVSVHPEAARYCLEYLLTFGHRWCVPLSGSVLHLLTDLRISFRTSVNQGYEKKLLVQTINIAYPEFGTTHGAENTKGNIPRIARSTQQSTESLFAIG